MFAFAFELLRLRLPPPRAFSLSWSLFFSPASASVPAPVPALVLASDAVGLRESRIWAARLNVRGPRLRDFYRSRHSSLKLKLYVSSTNSSVIRAQKVLVGISIQLYGDLAQGLLWG